MNLNNVKMIPELLGKGDLVLKELYKNVNSKPVGAKLGFRFRRWSSDCSWQTTSCPAQAGDEIIKPFLWATDPSRCKPTHLTSDFPYGHPFIPHLMVLMLTAFADVRTDVAGC